MKKILTLSSLCFILFLTACKKDKDVQLPAPPPQKTIKQTTLDEQWTFEYNANGTIKERMIGNAYREMFSYSAGKVDVETRVDGQLSGKATMPIVNGKPTQLTWTNYNDMGQPTTSYTETFEFNAKGLLQKRVYSSGEYNKYEYNAAGDLMLLTSFDDLGQPYSITEYTYVDKEDKHPQFTYLNTNLYGFFFPRLAIHLPLSEKRTNVQTNMIAFNMSFTYEFDSDGYVTAGFGHSLSANHSDRNWVNAY